jgi:nicotinamidase-related amidase
VANVSPRPALVVVDVQKGLDDPKLGRRSNPDTEKNIAELLAGWRALGLPVFHIRHFSREPGSPLNPEEGGDVRFKDEAAPLSGEAVIEKRVNSAFIGTNLEERLRRTGIEKIYICGLTTNHCVETTTRMAGNLGFETFLVSDACATFDRAGPDGTPHKAEDIHAMTLANVHGEFAAVVETRDALAAAERPAA